MDDSQPLFAAMSDALPAETIDLTGLELTDVLHFVYRDRLVAVKISDSDYALITAYDTNAVRSCYRRGLKYVSVGGRDIVQAIRQSLLQLYGLIVIDGMNVCKADSKVQTGRKQRWEKLKQLAF